MSEIMSSLSLATTHLAVMCWALSSVMVSRTCTCNKGYKEENDFYLFFKIKIKKNYFFFKIPQTTHSYILIIVPVTNWFRFFPVQLIRCFSFSTKYVAAFCCSCVINHTQLERACKRRTRT